MRCDAALIANNIANGLGGPPSAGLDQLHCPNGFNLVPKLSPIFAQQFKLNLPRAKVASLKIGEGHQYVFTGRIKSPLVKLSPTPCGPTLLVWIQTVALPPAPLVLT